MKEVTNASKDLLNYMDRIQALAFEFGPSLIKAILVLIIGFWIIRRVIHIIKQIFANSTMDVSLSSFLASIVSIVFKLMLLLAVAGMLGIETTSFVAIFGALMVGIGMAFNGSIGHFISGIMLMLFKPFTIGDLVTIAGKQTGTITAINAFNTTLRTLDNKKIIISNTNVTNNDIVNISGQDTIGVEITFGIGYEDDIDKARAVILKVGKECPYILDVPEQTVVVAELAASAVNLFTRPYCKSEHYWETKHYMLEHIKKAFDIEDIGIPFPQMDLNIKQPIT